MDKWKKKMITMLVFAVIAAAVFIMRRNETNPVSIFSWHWEEMQEREWKPLLQVMERLGIQKVYQDFDMDELPEMRYGFWELMRKEGCEVYYLCGDPKWAYISKQERVLNAIKEASLLKEESQGILKGIVFDVEPYTMGEWETDADELMESYVVSMENAYNAAHGYNLEVILCIPNFYDKEFEEKLDFLARECCDAIAVMNYSKKDQAEKIKVEAGLAQKYGKALIHISEVEDGSSSEILSRISEIRDIWKNISREYSGMGLEFSYHHLGTIEKAYGERHDE